MKEIIDFAVNDLGFIKKRNPIMFGVPDFYYKKELKDDFLQLEIYGELTLLKKTYQEGMGWVYLGTVINEKIKSKEELFQIVNSYE